MDHPTSQPSNDDPSPAARSPLTPAVIWIAVALVACGPAAAAWWWWNRSEPAVIARPPAGNTLPGADKSQPGSDRRQPAGVEIPEPTEPQEPIADTDYLGSQACAACHAERVAEFETTRHF